MRMNVDQYCGTRMLQVPRLSLLFYCFLTRLCSTRSISHVRVAPRFLTHYRVFFWGKSASAILFSRPVNSLDQRNTPATLVTVADGNPVLLNSTDEISKNQSVAREVSHRRRCCVLHVV